VKLLLDENLSPRLIEALSGFYPGSKLVRDCGLGSKEDDAGWNHAKANGFAIVSKDFDFAETSVLESNPQRSFGSASGIVRLLRLRFSCAPRIR
jgi:predicted nuclease of predicted toxin-antitoxin system